MTRPINVKLTEAEELMLRVLVAEKGYDSFSSVLRAGLGMIAEKHCLDVLYAREIEQERRRHPTRRNLRPLDQRKRKVAKEKPTVAKRHCGQCLTLLTIWRD